MFTLSPTVHQFRAIKCHFLDEVMSLRDENQLYRLLKILLKLLHDMTCSCQLNVSYNVLDTLMFMHVADSPICRNALILHKLTKQTLIGAAGESSCLQVGTNLLHIATYKEIVFKIKIKEPSMANGE